MDARVELQAEIDAPREVVFALVSTGDGLARWLDSASIEERAGGAVRLRLLDAEVAGKVVALDAPQHISFTWDYPAEPLASPSVDDQLIAIGLGRDRQERVELGGFTAGNDQRSHR